MEKFSEFYRHFITSTPLLRMHLFGKSAQWWLCFLLYNNLRRRIKSELENTELCPSQKLKLFSEGVKYPGIWSRSKTKAKIEKVIFTAAGVGTAYDRRLSSFEKCSILLIRLTRLQGACQALKSSPAVWWIRLSYPPTLPPRNTSRHISPIPPGKNPPPLM